MSYRRKRQTTSGVALIERHDLNYGLVIERWDRLLTYQVIKALADWLLALVGFALLIAGTFVLYLLIILWLW